MPAITEERESHYKLPACFLYFLFNPFCVWGSCEPFRAGEISILLTTASINVAFFSCAGSAPQRFFSSRHGFLSLSVANSFIIQVSLTCWWANMFANCYLTYFPFFCALIITALDQRRFCQPTAFYYNYRTSRYRTSEQTQLLCPHLNKYRIGDKEALFLFFSATCTWWIQ